jgi:hypothetical protein
LQYRQDTVENAKSSGLSASRFHINSFINSILYALVASLPPESGKFAMGKVSGEPQTGFTQKVYLNYKYPKGSIFQSLPIRKCAGVLANPMETWRNNGSSTTQTTTALRRRPGLPTIAGIGRNTDLR